jgi:CubicO group peptidase (beta-lactamase class C family)
MRFLAISAACALAAGLIWSGAALAQPVNGPDGLPSASPASEGFDPARLQRLHAAMDKVVDDKQLAGITTTVIRHGRIVDFDAYGVQSLATKAPMRADTIFRIYSQSKPITGVAMMILFEEGRWKLDDPVSKYVPEFADLKVFKGLDDKGQPILEDAKRPPTMRELMTHTAGFGYGLSNEHYVDKQFRAQKVLESNGLQAMIDKIAKIPLVTQPGTEWRYSAAVDIQGYIVEKLSGQPLGVFMQQHIFGPLKMEDTGFSVPADKVSRLAAAYGWSDKLGGLVDASPYVQDFTKAPPMESGGGGLVSTAGDYARFAQMLLNGGELEGVRILAPRTVQLMRTNQLPASMLVDSNGTAGARFNEAVGFGLDFMVVNDPLRAGTLTGKGTFSWGGAAGTWFWIDPENDVIVLGMIQRFGGVSGIDLRDQSSVTTYSSLLHPEK